jgi:hypothetical protein
MHGAAAVFQAFAMQSLMNLLRLSREVFEALNSLMQALRLARSARSFSFICLRVAGSAVVRSVWDVTGLVLSPDCAWIGPEAAGEQRQDRRQRQDRFEHFFSPWMKGHNTMG